MGKYYCYARFSSKPQQDGSSEERQLLDYGRKRAAEVGTDFVDVYVDRGKSGWTGAHLDGALGRMIEDVRLGKIVPGGEDVIGVEAHNRLSRMPPGDAILQFFGFLKAGITLDIKGNLRTWASINGEQGFGVLVLDLIEMFQAHAESQGKSNMGIKTNRLKREKVRAGERKAMKAGVGWFVGHRCPAWLRPLDVAVDGYLYEIIPEIALVVRRIFAWADSGIGTEVLARRLNDEQTPPLGQHYRTKKPLKNGWSNGTARHLLRNRAVIGEYQPHLRSKGQKIKEGEPIKGYYPPLFPDDPNLFHRVQDGMTKRRIGGKGRNGRHYANLIKGMGRCECCGGTVTMKGYPPTRKNRKGEIVMRKGATTYLRCENARRGTILTDGALAGRRCDNRAGFPYAAFEPLLFQLFDDCMQPILAGLLPPTRHDDLLHRRCGEIEAEIANHERAIDRLYEAFMKPDVPDSLIARTQAKIADTDAATTALKQERDKLAEAIKAAEFANSSEFADRVRAGIAKVKSAEPQERYDARAKLADLLRDRIGVMLHPRRMISVVMKGFGGEVTDMLGIMFTPERILVAHSFDSEGRVSATDDAPWPKFEQAA